MAVLSMIRTDGWHKNGRGLTLELSAGSPSDNEHHFKMWPTLQRDYPHLEDVDTQRKYLKTKAKTDYYLSDDIHSIANGRIDRYRASCYYGLTGKGWPQSRFGLTARRLVRALGFNFRDVALDIPANKALRFPEVKAVSTLLIRRQFYRDIATPSLTKLLSEGLTCLESLSRENWRSINKAARRTDDVRYAPHSGITGRRTNYLLQSALSTSLKRLNLFENFHPYLHGGRDTKQYRASRIQILPSLANSAPNLEHLSVSFLTDAIDALGLRSHLGQADIADHVTATLPNLRSIALTSQEFLRTSGGDLATTQESITNLLEAAAAATTKMPRLEVMEIWNWEQVDKMVDLRGRACVFRYETSPPMPPNGRRNPSRPERRPTLTWRTNWKEQRAGDVKMGDRAVGAWQAATCDRTDTTLPSRASPTLVQTPMPSRSYQNYGAVLDCLRLRGLMLDPRSLIQAEVDGQCMYGWPGWPLKEFTPRGCGRSCGHMSSQLCDGRSAGLSK